MLACMLVKIKYTKMQISFFLNFEAEIFVEFKKSQKRYFFEFFSNAKYKSRILLRSTITLAISNKTMLDFSQTQFFNANLFKINFSPQTFCYWNIETKKFYDLSSIEILVGVVRILRNA